MELRRNYLTNALKVTFVMFYDIPRLVWSSHGVVHNTIPSTVYSGIIVAMPAKLSVGDIVLLNLSVKSTLSLLLAIGSTVRPNTTRVSPFETFFVRCQKPPLYPCYYAWPPVVKH